MDQERRANRLREAREARDLKTYDVAALVRRDPSMIAKYERGQVPVPEAVYRKLADEWNTSVDTLMGRCTCRAPEGGTHINCALLNDFGVAARERDERLAAYELGEAA
jgi:transcriptional regulator with XRE-family HTH domain